MHQFPYPFLKVSIAPAIAQRAAQFAEQVISTVHYGDANQWNQQKIQRDHCISKIGEEAVRLAFESCDRAVEGPDYRIYDSKGKSWESDLYVDGIPLAVKTQEKHAALKFGLSWTFQAGSRRSRRDPILDTPDAWVCFVAYDEDTQNCWVYSPHQIKTLQFGDPKLAKLKGFKTVVYGDHMLKPNPG